MPPPSSAAKGAFLAKKLAAQDQLVLAFSCARKYSSKRELLELLGDTGASKSKKKLKLPKPMPVPIPTAKTHSRPGSPLTVSPSLSILLKSDDTKASSRSSSSESATSHIGK